MILEWRSCTSGISGTWFPLTLDVDIEFVTFFFRQGITLKKYKESSKKRKTISWLLEIYCIFIEFILQFSLQFIAIYCIFIEFILQFYCNYLPVDHQQSSIPCSKLVGLPKCFVSKHLCQHRCKEPLWCSPIWFWKPFELSYFWYKPDKQM